ncbi:hypothetical protein [Oligoflexus tunisiensis]|uniref:hypothetical protein n=1 Tax=Oligoflexus tunisiensis TaxID=708132 RepID=UPI00114CE840|nr:hypothetical protein [Oligoflexus tunisiensis]
MPTVGEEHDVELTLPDPTELRVLTAQQDHEPGVQAAGQDYFRFRGECEAVHEDDVIIVRLATNWIEMVNSENFACKVGDWIEFTVPKSQVEIYPIGG